MRQTLKFVILYVLVYYSGLVESADCDDQVDDLKCPTWFSPNNCTAEERRLCPRLCASCPSIGQQPVMRVNKGKRSRDDEYDPSYQSEDSGSEKPRGKKGFRKGTRDDEASPSGRSGPKPQYHGPFSNNPRQSLLGNPNFGPKNHPLPSNEPLVNKNESYYFFDDRVNKTGEPCNDFYEFACGEFLATHSSLATNDFFSAYKKKLDWGKLQQKDIIMTRNYRKATDAEKKMLKYRDTCLSVPQNSSGLTNNLCHKIKKMSEQFSMLNIENLGRQPGLEHLLADLTQESGVEFMYRFDVLENGRNNFEPIIRLPELIVLSPEFYEREDVETKKKSLLAYMHKVVRRIANDCRAKIIVILHARLPRILKFDEKLAKAMLKHRNERFRTGRHSMSSVQTHLTAINWEVYAKHNPLLPRDFKTDRWKEERIVLVESENAMKAVDALYNELKTSDRNLLIDYLFVRFILTQVPYLDGSFFQEHYQSNHRVYHTPVLEDKEVHCYNEIMRHFGLVGDNLYNKAIIKHVFPIKNIKQIMDDLHKAMKEMLVKQPWMSETTRQHAERKLDDLKIVRGFDELVPDMKKIEEEYAGVELKEDESYIEMTKKLRIHRGQKVMMQIHGPGYNLLPRWPTIDASVVNDVPTNTLFVSNTVVHTPIHEYHRPAVLNYGMLGSIIGRELTRAFVFEGSHFNEHAAYHPWWDLQTIRHFGYRANALAGHYSEQVDPLTGKRLNGRRTLVENIADSGAIRAAFEAFKFRAVARPVPLKGYEKFDHDQLFFLSYATYHCSAYSEQKAQQMRLIDTQAPARFRVNTVLANYLKFAEVFKCKYGTEMNPINKHTVWWTPPFPQKRRTHVRRPHG